MRKITSMIIIIALLAVSAFAHERQAFDISGTPYLFTIGSVGEPVFVDDKTGVDLRITLADPVNVSNRNSPRAKPVVGLENTLQVELIAGEKRQTLALEAAYNDPGAYRAPFFPTIATTYTYRVFGTLNDTAVDLSFTCNPAGHPATPEETAHVQISEGVVRTFKAGAFGCPREKQTISFPEPVPSLHELATPVPRQESKLPIVAIVLSVLALVSTALSWKK